MVSSIHRDEYVVLLRLLRQCRTDSGLTQGQFAEALGRAQSFVSDMERGFRRIDLIQLRDICAVLNISLLDFVARFEAEISASRLKRSKGTTTRRNTSRVVIPQLGGDLGAMAE